MLLLRTSLVLACAAVAAAAVALPAEASTKVKRPAVLWQGGTQNFTPANRRPEQIRYVVIHVTEGSFWGAVEWLQNPEAQGSSHYVVARKGGIVQLVREKDVAWHAGNKRINELSTGIEHAGMTYDPAGFTRAQYEASAKLAAYIARRSLIPITRRHFIGHGEVPNPLGPGVGGADNHTDPGPYWDWNLYLKLVRKYAYPPSPVSVASATIYNGQTIAGRVPWRATVKGKGVTRVDFLVNGKVLWRTSRAPYAFAPRRGLNTTGLKNGRHVLELRAYRGKRVLDSRRLGVVVRNKPFELTTAGLHPNMPVAGVLTVRANTRTAPAHRVELLVNGRAVARDGRAPFVLRWDARKAKQGAHRIQVRATAKDGRVAARVVRVVVPKPGAAPAPPPPPPPTEPGVPAPVLIGQSIADGATVSGTVEWRAQLTGRVVKVEYLVDGVVRHTATKAPLAFQWDTTREQPGAHVLTVRLVGPTGKVTEGSVTATVAAPPPPAP